MEDENLIVEINPNEVCSSEHKGKLPDVELSVYWGSDGTPVIEINTEGLDEDRHGPILRVWLNNETIWENPEVPTNGERANP